MPFRSAAASLNALTLLLPLSAWAGVGSNQIAVIEPPVPHPAEKPCAVTLFANAQFGANNVNINYAPPPNCPGPWAKVILSMDIGLNAGIQYDRTGTLWLGGVNLWFGTTSEPSPNSAPKWHIEKDLTEDTSLLEQAQSGFVLIANYTNSTDTSIITATGNLLFYPATPAAPAPVVPDLVLPLAAPGGGTVALNDGTSTLSSPLNLPQNVRRAALDLYLQGQSNDEFWYTCVPNSLTGPLESCGNGALREGEVTIDGTPAGVAPVYPWIFTGGIDPYLWFPMPGVQTLNFKPFRVELTPFAGLLSDGNTHNLAVSVYQADSYFSAAGVLYVYLDHGGSAVTGAVTRNTLTAAPNPRTRTAQGTQGQNQKYVVNTSATRNFTISGYAMTSAGKVVTTVQQTGSFTNDQKFLLGNTLYEQSIKQDTETTVDVTAQASDGITESKTQYSYPLTVDYKEVVGSKGNGKLVTSIAQGYQTHQVNSVNNLPVSQFDLLNAITPMDTLLFNASGYITGNTNQSSTEVYSTFGTGTGCFSRTLTAAGNVLTGETTDRRCK